MDKDGKTTNVLTPSLSLDEKNENFFAEIRRIVDSARSRAYAAVNSAMVEAYWLIGKQIVEREQQGENRATYGQNLIKELSKRLVQEYGAGFSVVNLKNMRFFYLTFRSTLNSDTDEQLEKGHAVRALLDDASQIPYLGRLSWSHYRAIMRVDSEAARRWYLRKAAENQWSSRTLDRNIATQYYERLLMPQKKEPVVQEMREKTIDYQRDKFEFIKNPAVLEFLNLPNNLGYRQQNFPIKVRSRFLRDVYFEINASFGSITHLFENCTFPTFSNGES